MAENAEANGAKFVFNSKVTNIIKKEGVFEITAEDGRTFASRAVVNAAGVYSDEINNLISARKLKIAGRRGEYCLYDKNAAIDVKRTIFQAPDKLGKGVLVSPTAHGNILIGPNAQDIEDKSGVETTGRGLADIFLRARLSVPGLTKKDIITQFAGIRARLAEGDDFIVGESDVEGFFNAVGIESPGLTAAPAIGKAIAEKVSEFLKAPKKSEFLAERKAIQRFAGKTSGQRRKLIEKNPLYGRVICRCEEVTEAEIVEAIRRGATDLDGVKRRTRAGMGRCQSGFCSPRVLEILARELNIPYTAVTKSGGKSYILIGKKGNE